MGSSANDRFDFSSECAPWLNNGIMPWFALKVRPRHEKIASATLTGKGFETFLPMFRSERRWSDRTKQLDIPLFATYLFCRFHLQDQVRILSTPGLLHVVSNGATPVAVEEAEIARVRVVVSSSMHVEPWPAVSPGQRVRLEGGPLQGLEGTLIEFRGSHRLIVSVALLQRSVAVEIERRWVAPLRSAREPRVHPSSSSGRMGLPA
jgi:transcription antitermination factor NusG